MTGEQLKEAIDAYRDQEMRQLYAIKDYENRIKELERLIEVERHRPIYDLIYKPEYGDRREFAESVAERLRKGEGL